MHHQRISHLFKRAEHEYQAIAHIRQRDFFFFQSLNKGRRDGLENGHVLALYSKGERLRKEKVTLPDVRYGLIFVFRTFEKVAYALVMQTSLPVQVLDSALTP